MNVNSNQAIINMLKHRFGNNQIINNAIDMMQNGNIQGVEQLARNLCNSKGIDINSAIEQIKKQYRI